MISDETFPTDLIDEFEDFRNENGKELKSRSMDNFNHSISSQSSNSSTEVEHSMINSMETDRLIKSTDYQDTSSSMKLNQFEFTHTEASFESSTSKNAILPPPCAPIKKKKSFSCQNLNIKKNGHSNNYDHVESKVKKLIENLAEDRRKTLLRHKSMPVCTPQTPVIDEKPEIGTDINDLKRELRRKSIKIYELEEICEMKDNQIYELDREKSRMKMIFDNLRSELQELKEMEKQFKRLKSQYSPFKSQRDALIQTEDSGIDTEVNILRESVVITHHKEQNHVQLNPAIRQLAFENSNLDQSRFSEINNTSSEYLIPETEVHNMDNINNIDVIEGITRDVPESSKPNKKKKKFKFFSFVPCVSK